MTEQEIFLARARQHTRQEVDCFLYTKTFSDGYGRIWWKQRSHRVHRLAWELLKGPIPAGFVLCHTCKHRNCWNFEHLYVGTFTDNNQDTFKFGKGKRGEAHANAVLTEDKVKTIRALYKQGLSYSKIALQVHCNWRTVGTVVRGETWTHVE